MKTTCILAAGACAGLIGLAASCSDGGEALVKEQTQHIVHRARGAGRWFPSHPGALRAMVEGFIQEADVPHIGGRIVGAVAPHAGYVYSGAVAGHTFRALRDNAAAGHEPDTVIILGFTHGHPLRGVALLDGNAVSTPLGEAVLDREAAAFLAAQSARISFDADPHGGEHSAENEIPFTQAALPGVPIVVALIGDHEQQTRADLLAALTALAGRKKIVVVASTDLLHDPDYGKVAATDKQTLAAIASLDHEALLASWDYRRQTCCGIGPVIVTMQFAAAQGCGEARVLRYSTSRDEQPEPGGPYVVGYGAVVMAAPAP